ncbi:ABC transporter ATP-binding protein [Klugiella xanthotipulae]|uniref:ABC-2 type transport system ATP-binding protein n=1 Tax=Klugiella xanthotipulae TaxID=244735 RepID=A0A543I511_9MICO|nr:ATP-binding cassette domain-containing protein [Klugiella xanthotipulae]TQM65560.1 ABC-2 type transport system ATP-binding protein [Klugiella xanthotipulae]
MTGFEASTDSLGVTRRGIVGLTDVSLTLAPDRVHAVLGRAGSGKSTLLTVLAGQRRPTAGSVAVDGEDPFEHPQLTRGIQLARGTGTLLREESLAASIQLMALLRPTADAALAHRLCAEFSIDPRKKPMRLSLTQRRTAAALLALASRAPLTLFDEVTAAMSAPTRMAFYAALRAEQAEHPRTIVLAAREWDESTELVEQVTVLRQNRVALSAPLTTFSALATVFSGTRLAVTELDASTPSSAVLARTSAGGRASLTVLGPVSVETALRADTLGLTRAPLAPGDLLGHLTDRRTDLSPTAVAAPATPFTPREGDR